MAWDEPFPVETGDTITKALWNKDVVGNTLALAQENQSLHEVLAIVAPIGLIQPFAGLIDQLAPFWLPCDGSIIPADARYQQLRNRLGHMYDPDLRDYKVPDLRGRALIGVGNEGVDWNAINAGLGQKVGDQRLQSHGHGITDPQHSHGVPVRGDGGGWTAANNNAGPPGAYLETDKRSTNITINAAGTGGGANVPPSLGINFVILAATS